MDQKSQVPSSTSSLDPDAVNLAKAIRQTESGGNFTAKGKSGEFGAYQFTPETWGTLSQKHLGKIVPLESATREQQNEVAYKQIKEWKDGGKNVGQIASLWNSGKPNAYLDQSYKGTNKYGAKYDVPAYAKSVAMAYHTIKNGGQVGVDPQNPSSTAAQPQQPQGLGGELLGRLNDASGALANKDISGFSKALQVGGSAAGAVGDVVGAGLELIPGVKQAEGLIGKGVGALSNTGVGQSAIKGYQDFSQKHPELSGDINAVGNIATLLPIGEGFSLAKEGVGRALGKTALNTAISDVTPELSIKAGGKNAARQGLIKTAISGRVAPVGNSASKDVAEEVIKSVPNYKKLGTFTDKLNATRDAVYSEAEQLKQKVQQSGQDKIFPFKELNSRMMGIEKPIALKSDKVLGKQFDLARDAAIKLAKESGGTISGLFDARKGFDDLVEKQFPNLYDRTNAPMRDAITAIRREMNDFIAEQLPDVNFKESLTKQSRLFRAIDALAQKAYGEVGSTRVSRFGDKHPYIKKAAQVVGGGLLGGLGFEKGRELIEGQ